jgi:hypothetical protein
MRRVLTLAVAGCRRSALLLATAGSPRGIKEGGTFRMAITLPARFQAIDPALYGLEGRLSALPVAHS